jgi:hypothetical protein
MFRALLAHPQEALHKSTWYIAYVLCQLAAPRMEWNSNPGALPWFHYPDIFFTWVGINSYGYIDAIWDALNIVVTCTHVLTYAYWLLHVSSL